MAAGHSYGDYVALWSAGVMSETDLIKISEIRGRILSHTNGDGRGWMAALSCGVKSPGKSSPNVKPLHWQTSTLPLSVLSRVRPDKIKTVLEVAQKMGVQAKEIAVSQAFHSQFMAHSQKPLRAAVSELSLNNPAFDVYSNTDAKKYEADTAKIVGIVWSNTLFAPLICLRSAANAARRCSHLYRGWSGSVLSGLADSILQSGTTPGLSALDGSLGPQQFGAPPSHARATRFLRTSIDLQCLFDGRVTTQDCLNFKALPAVETNSRKLLYLINSSHIEQIGAADTANAAPAKQLAPSAAKTATTQFNDTGAPVSAQLKPTSGNGNQNASLNQATPASRRSRCENAGTSH